MPESVFILLAGGIMFAVLITDPKQVELRWLRLAGILALCFAALGMYFEFSVNRRLTALDAGLGASILAQLGFAQSNLRVAQRLFALAAVACAIILVPVHRLAAGAIAATTGLCLMD